LYPKPTRGERIWRRMEEFSLLTCFQVEYGIPSGPGADGGDHIERAVAISSLVSGGAFLSGRSLGGGKNGSCGGKKWSNRLTFIR